MLDWILKTLFGTDLGKSKKRMEDELEKSIIRPFPDAPVKIDFFKGGVYGRRTPEYAAVSYGRMFTQSEEKILIDTMGDACVSFYGEYMDKGTLDGFRNFIIRKCKVAGPQENYNAPSSYGTPQEQLDAINSYVESEFCRQELGETPMDRYYDAYRDLQEIRKIEKIYESRKATERILKAMDEEKKKRQEEYQKYRSIWY